MHQLAKAKPASRPFHKRPWVRRSGLVLLLLLLVWGTYRAIRPDPNLKKVKQLREEFANAKDWTPEQRRDKGREMRDAMQKLSPSQRDALAAEGMKRMQAEMERYAKMSPAEKTRYLDEQIARQQKMRQQFAQQNPGAGQRPPPGTFANGPRGGSAEDREKRRKEMLNKTTPEFRALRDQYRKDMAARRQQWGLPAGPRA